MKSAPTIGFEYRPSRALIAALWAVAALAVLAIASSGLPGWLRFALAVAAVAYAIRDVARLRRPPLRALRLRGDGAVELALADGRDAAGTLRGARVLGPLIVLRLAWGAGSRAALVLLPDNLDADTRRRLRVRLGAGQGIV
ncbi:hypothetical protein MBSD_n2629 [Mizugakiibacter sediminis]|uniref:Toxin CptA n=1 Tax=Mizugakiibacter sediminis TaxID=1475481 RepID=A0A0K8QQW8_9GAMM|nr:protein YgfX [Mizugakiibacter sediminis]GAP67308.1 hypothetical protein MBSD_n2629 [Mizugakiibacter sediminis]